MSRKELRRELQAAYRENDKKRFEIVSAELEWRRIAKQNEPPPVMSIPVHIGVAATAIALIAFACLLSIKSWGEPKTWKEIILTGLALIAGGDFTAASVSRRYPVLLSWLAPDED